MLQPVDRSRPWTCFLGVLGILVVLGASGCQSSIGGQVLPSPYWQQDDVQYFPPGPEFKLSKEAAALKAWKSQQARGGQPAPTPEAGVVPPGPAPEGEAP